MSRSWSGGSSRRWRKLRAVILQRDGYTCKVPRNGRPCGAHATHVDHIVPRADGGDMWDPSNLRAACAPCNLSRGTGATAKRGTVPVHVVIGPPAGGKTTHAVRNTTGYGIVVDLDAIADALTPQRSWGHDYPKHVRHVAIGARRAAINRAVNLTDAGAEVWIIHALPSVDQMRQYIDDEYDVVVCDPGRDEVMRRIRDSDRSARHIDAADRWYTQRDQLLALITKPEEWSW